MWRYIRRNLSELVNVVEAVLRLLGSLATLTPTDKDDTIIDGIKFVFAKVKDFLSKVGE